MNYRRINLPSLTEGIVSLGSICAVSYGIASDNLGLTVIGLGLAYLPFIYKNERRFNELEGRTRSIEDKLRDIQ